jgi:hypothetical protein
MAATGPASPVAARASGSSNRPGWARSPRASNLRDQRSVDDIVLRRPQSLPAEEIRIELALRAFTGRPP